MLKIMTGVAIIAASLFIASPTLAYIVQPGERSIMYIGENVKTDINKSVAPKVEVQEVKKEAPIDVDRDLLARLVRAEAQGESFNGKVAVAEIVINRVMSPSFPNSVQAVIYQAGQFSPVSNGSINRPADDESYRAVDSARQGSNLTNGALFFYNPKVAESRWLDSRKTTASIGNHVFKK